MKDLKEIEYILGEEEDFGLQAISIVDEPAIGEAFVMLAKQEPVYLAKDSDKQLLIGALLIPEQRIYRRNNEGEEFNMFVTQETINDLTQKFMRDGNQNEFTLQHEEKLIDLSVQEIWLVADSKKDKSAVYGFNYPIGTLMAITHVKDSEQWQSLKDSDVKGYSVEMLLQPRKTEFSVIETLAKLKLK